MAPKKASLTAKTGTKTLTQKPASKGAPSPAKPPVNKVAATAVSKKGANGSKTAPTKKTSTSPTKGKAKGKENIAANQPKGKKWTYQDESAVVIQKYIRRHLAKKELEKRKKERQDYEDLMDKIQKETLSEKQSLITRHQLALVDCEDANNNTPLSEAAGGGHVDTIKMLIQRGANLNSRGRYKRVPLWRAAFGGHIQAVQTLLEYGGDPRLVADDGTNAFQVAAIPAVEQVFQEWDIKQTDKLLEKLETEKNNRQEEERKLREAESNRLEREIAKAEKENQAHQKEVKFFVVVFLVGASFSFDLLKEANHLSLPGELSISPPTMYLIVSQAIHDAEAVLAHAQKKAEASKEALAQAKLKLREQNKTEESSTDAAANVKGVKVLLRDLDDVLFRDVGGKIAEDGRWPLLIDTSPQSSTFLRYRDTNYINALNPKHVEPEVIRLALLGGLRYGKPVVLDMMEVDMFDTVAMRFDDVQNGLMSSLMTKDLLKNNKYLELIRPCDGDEYSKTSFLGARIEKFMFIIVTQQWNPPETLMDQTYPIRVIVPSRPDV
ncbi:PREDICTED: putative IQ motif and ankyrin repeat domain-containing protein [Acropora digitifera]|uniref:putative IQ motif and ankyrin repeat domain-containing protein n=1 Tax=Acropora digitifera TaxID=70779 RepID=UPI00077A3F1F|nr:PREDICTED: putative IQ motif and ankyrin repeat domain-containing protein [Acropora digitifera]